MVETEFTVVNITENESIHVATFLERGVAFARDTVPHSIVEIRRGPPRKVAAPLPTPAAVPGQTEDEASSTDRSNVDDAPPETVASGTYWLAIVEFDVRSDGAFRIREITTVPYEIKTGQTATITGSSSYGYNWEIL